MKQSNLERLFAGQLRIIRIDMEPEYRFHPDRRWRFDFADPARKIAVECEGGTWTGGRHVRGDGFQKDCEKYNEAARLGWRVFRFTKGMISSGDAIAKILEVYGEEDQAGQG